MPKRIFKHRCHQSPNISKQTILASFDMESKTRSFLESLDDENWDILAFNPEDRQVCVTLTSTSGHIHTLSFTLPVYSNSWRK